MDKEKIFAKLKEDFKEEINDFYGYLEMSEEAEKAHMDQGYHVLKDMAKEEYIHAKHLKNILSGHGYWTDEFQTNWNEAEMKYAMI